MPDRNYYASLVSQVVNRYSMPADRPAHVFPNKLEQMKFWLSDPVLRPEAIAWARGKGYEIICDDYGTPIDFEHEPLDF